MVAARWAFSPGARTIRTMDAGMETNDANWWMRPRNRGFGGSARVISVVATVMSRSDREVGDAAPREPDQGLDRTTSFGLRASRIALCHGLNHTHEREGYYVRIAPVDLSC